MKKEFEKYLKSNETLRKMEKQKKQYEEEFWKIQNEISYYLRDHSYEEATEHFKDRKNEKEENAEKKTIIYEKIKKESLKNNLLYNNFIYKFLEEKEEKIKNIISKYENKAIGEKTQEKIENEIKEEIKTIDLFCKLEEIYPHFRGDFLNYEISIEIREKDKKTECYKYDIKVQFQKKTSYNCYEDETKTFYYTSLAQDFSYQFYTIQDLLYIENIEKTVNEIIKEEKKIKALLNKKEEELKAITKKYNNYISSYNLNSEKNKHYKVENTINLY